MTVSSEHQQHQENIHTQNKINEEKAFFQQIHVQLTRELNELCAYWKGNTAFSTHLEQRRTEFHHLSKDVTQKTS